MVNNDNDILEYNNQMKEKYESNDPKLIIIKESHKVYVKTLINEGPKVYNQMRSFFSNNPETTSVPELKWCLDYLIYGLDIPFIQNKCNENAVLLKLRDSLYLSILSVKTDTQKSYLYGPTIRVIMKIIEFYDILIRSIKVVPPYYHKYRYERYVEYCISMANNGLFIFPTFEVLDATDLLKLRCYPMFPIGLSTTIIFVDEYDQTPIEFFIHDINHTRRMFDSNISDMKRNKIDTSSFHETSLYYDKSYKCLQEILYITRHTLDIPDTNINNGHLDKIDYSKVSMTEAIDVGYAQLITIIIFEITHEDAMPIQKDVICSTILRNSGIETVFPRINKQGKVFINIESGGSVLGFVKYKLRYGFFDNIDSLTDEIVGIRYRTDKQILIATQILLKKLCKRTVSINSDDYFRIIINITDKHGLNIPNHEDNLIKFKNIKDDSIYGDFTINDVNRIRKLKGINIENLFTGDRPKDVTEQGTNLLTILGSSSKGVKKTKRNKFIKKNKKQITRRK